MLRQLTLPDIFGHGLSHLGCYCYVGEQATNASNLHGSSTDVAEPAAAGEQDPANGPMDQCIYSSSEDITTLLCSQKCHLHKITTKSDCFIQVYALESIEVGCRAIIRDFLFGSKIL